jgi:hypothetical protein
MEASSLKEEVERSLNGKLTVFHRIVFRSLHPFLPCKEAQDVKLCFQWLTFDERTTFASIDRRMPLSIEYLRDEMSFRHQPEYSEVLKYAQNYVSGWFKDHDLFWDFIPKHGPGATAELSRKEANALNKCRFFSIDDGIERFVREYLPFLSIEDLFFDPKKETDSSWRTCRVRFVPKTALTNRVISAEPVTLQWLQQGIFRSLLRHFDRHPEMHIHLGDQLTSRWGALLGSRSGVYDTIDLSKASDYVTCSLVRYLFHSTRLLEPLMATRSKYAEIDNGRFLITIELEKFAPMGSACCFPIECVVFSALVAEAITRVTGRRPRIGDYWVYGDDIVVRHEYAEEVIRVLTEVGFLVNRGKSFLGQASGKFREACGMFACNGLDITPLRIGRGMVTPSRLSNGNKSAGVVSSWVSLYNQTYEYGYLNLRHYLTNRLRQMSWYPFLPRSDRDLDLRAEPFVLTDYGTDTNFRCRHRRSKDLQCTQVRCLVGGTTHKTRKFSEDEERALYFLDLWTRELKTGEQNGIHGGAFDSSAIRHSATSADPPRLRWQWINLS